MERSKACNTKYNKIFVQYILFANEQYQHLQTDLLAGEELVISVSFGRERR